MTGGGCSARYRPLMRSLRWSCLRRYSGLESICQVMCSLLLRVLSPGKRFADILFFETRFRRRNFRPSASRCSAQGRLTTLRTSRPCLKRTQGIQVFCRCCCFTVRLVHAHKGGGLQTKIRAHELFFSLKRRARWKRVKRIQQTRKTSKPAYDYMDAHKLVVPLNFFFFYGKQGRMFFNP